MAPHQNKDAPPKVDKRALAHSSTGGFSWGAGSESKEGSLRGRVSVRLPSTQENAAASIRTPSQRARDGFAALAAPLPRPETTVRQFSSVQSMRAPRAGFGSALGVGDDVVDDSDGSFSSSSDGSSVERIGTTANDQAAHGSARHVRAVYVDGDGGKRNRRGQPRRGDQSRRGSDKRPLPEHPGRALRRGRAEARRSAYRTVFSQDDWAVHRSTARYRRHLASLPSSGMVTALAPFLLLHVLIATGLMIYVVAVENGWGPAADWDLPPDAKDGFTVSAFALALLLVFRTNSSYDRWWEARKLWGLLTNRCRNLAREAINQLALARWRTMEDPQRCVHLCRWLAALPECLRFHLRDETEGLSDYLGDLGLDDASVDFLTDVKQCKHRPNHVILVLGQIIADAPTMSERTRIALDLEVTIFSDVVGICERILKTPVPLFYTHHTSRLLSIWLFFLPLGLWSSLRWVTPFAQAVISFLLLGVDEIGLQIEEPFTILPLGAMAATIRSNIREMLDSATTARECHARPDGDPPQVWPPIATPSDPDAGGARGKWLGGGGGEGESGRTREGKELGVAGGVGHG